MNDYISLLVSDPVSGLLVISIYGISSAGLYYTSCAIAVLALVLSWRKQKGNPLRQKLLHSFIKLETLFGLLLLIVGTLALAYPPSLFLLTSGVLKANGIAAVVLFVITVMWHMIEYFKRGYNQTKNRPRLRGGLLITY